MQSRAGLGGGGRVGTLPQMRTPEKGSGPSFSSLMCSLSKHTKRLILPVFKAPILRMHISSWGLGQCSQGHRDSSQAPTPSDSALPSCECSIRQGQKSPLPTEPTTRHPSSQGNPSLHQVTPPKSVKYSKLGVRLPRRTCRT